MHGLHFQPNPVFSFTASVEEKYATASTNEKPQFHSNYSLNFFILLNIFLCGIKYSWANGWNFTVYKIFLSLENICPFELPLISWLQFSQTSFAIFCAIKMKLWWTNAKPSYSQELNTEESHSRLNNSIYYIFTNSKPGCLNTSLREEHRKSTATTKQSNATVCFSSSPSTLVPREKIYDCRFWVVAICISKLTSFLSLST